MAPVGNAPSSGASKGSSPGMAKLAAKLAGSSSSMMASGDASAPPRPAPHPAGITIPRGKVMTPGGWPWARKGLGGSTSGYRPAPLRNAQPSNTNRNA